MTRFLVVLMILVASLFPTAPARAEKREQPLQWYQDQWCTKVKGQAGAPLIEGPPCDCLTASYALAFVYADEWAAAVGRSLDFARKTGKKPGIVLVAERYEDRKFKTSLNSTLEAYKLDVKVWLTGSGAPEAENIYVDPSLGPGSGREPVPPTEAKPTATAPAMDKPPTSTSQTLNKEYLAILEENQAIMTYNIGLAYQRKGELNRAIAEYTQALEIWPRYTKALNNRGVSYLLQGDPDRALTDLTLAIEIDPGFAQAYYNRGLAWQKKEEYKKAWADMSKASELAPDDETYRAAAKDLKWRAQWGSK